MPIEIRELIIKATIVEQKKEEDTNSLAVDEGTVSVDQITDQIANKVTEILKRKNER